MPDTTNVIEVSSIRDSKLKAGDNKAVISHLPKLLVEDSLRVEGRGAACTIHEVAIWQAPAPNVKSTPKLEDMRKKKSRLERAWNRKTNAIESIHSFYNSLTVDQADVIKLVKTTRQLESVHEELDEKVLNLEKELEILKQQIRDERHTHYGV